MQEIRQAQPSVKQVTPQVVQVPPQTQAQTAVITKSGASVFKKTIWSVVILVALLAIGFFGYKLYADNQKLRIQLKQNEQQTAGEDQVKTLVAQVGKLIVLPVDEQPTVATVSDLSKLQGQAFFARAQVGDKVLIYSQAKKAILYRPSSNQLIEVAPFNTAAPTPVN